MIGSAEWRPFLRRIVEAGGDIVDVARAIRVHGRNGQYVQAAAALRQEFGLKISEALTVQTGGPGQAEFDVVFLKNIDPVVAMAQLEAIMTGCSYEEASQRPRSGELLSSPEDGPPFVVSLSDTLIDALGTATQDDLRRVAELWSMTEELQQSQVNAETAAGVLEALVGLA
ncbi:hypothetical protein [Planotetraspora kaengkrachanensis]|uniref:Uncharacterized protein n=1 Tax=Planotetraspora kaengkrachanensis TaxID=575193 RepID=A0A8J3VBL7_9ACTN|nr:hypothetical protein [Planotetraspora kaengkrachanensis]GIG83714.1 hypothetical protein Pka01_68410 [Planotetraspora kaengkrachanensis]